MDAEEALNRILSDPAFEVEKRILVERLKENRRQFDEAEYVGLDDKGLTELFDGLKERARRRSHEE